MSEKIKNGEVVPIGVLIRVNGEDVIAIIPESVEKQLLDLLTENEHKALMVTSIYESPQDIPEKHTETVH